MSTRMDISTNYAIIEKFYVIVKNSTQPCDWLFSPSSIKFFSKISNSDPPPTRKAKIDAQVIAI